MRSTIAAILFLLPAYAQAQTPVSKEVSVPLSRIIALSNAISALDGPERIIKDGANERVARDITAYKFAPGLRIAMARNLNAMRGIAEAYEKELSAVRAAIIAKCSCELKDGTPQVSALSDENRRLLATTQTVTLFFINESELKLDTNQIPASILSGLEPILEFAK